MDQRFTLRTAFWNDTMVFATHNLRGELTKYLPKHYHRFVPHSVQIYFDQSIDAPERSEVTARFLIKLTLAVLHIAERAYNLIITRHLDQQEFDEILFSRCTLQEWIFYYSDEDRFQFDSKKVMHVQSGEAYHFQVSDGESKTVFISHASQLHNLHWAENISTHVAHSVITPKSWLQISQHFTKSPYGKFITMRSLSDLSKGDIIAIMSCWNEIVTSYLSPKKVGLSLPGMAQTGLVGIETVSELKVFFRMSQLMFPGYGFETSERFLMKNDPLTQLENSFAPALVVACLRALHATREFVTATKAPSPEWFRYHGRNQLVTAI